MNLEYCIECGMPTGRAGRSDDSIYVELARDWHRGRGDDEVEPKGTELRPLCRDCYQLLLDEGVIW